MLFKSAMLLAHAAAYDTIPGGPTFDILQSPGNASELLFNAAVPVDMWLALSFKTSFPVDGVLFSGDRSMVDLWKVDEPTFPQIDDQQDYMAKGAGAVGLNGTVEFTYARALDTGETT